MENETIKERFLGTIFGQAVGDALGLSTEFMSKQEVDRFYPNRIEDYSQIVQDDHRRRWQRGDWTDDTDMMLCILDAFNAEKGGVFLCAPRRSPSCQPAAGGYRSRQPGHFLESASLHPPQAALQRFSQ